MNHTGDLSPPQRRSWMTRTLIGVVLATFFSDLSHETATAVLPLFLASAGFGPAALGIMEGLADLLRSLSKLAGGVVGHHVRHKRPWASAAYLVTALATGALGLAGHVAAFVTLRCTAWISRGFRGPLRDVLLADAVEPSHYGRAFGFERAGDMLGAVAGPLLAALLVWQGVRYPTIILWTVVPGVAAAAAMFWLATEREPPPAPTQPPAEELAPPLPRPAFPRAFWLFLIGVFLFGMGDFSRTFLIWLAARALGQEAAPTTGVLSVAVLLYALHNVVSALAAYPIGHLGDRRSKLSVLLSTGYAVGVATNLLLAALAGSLAWLVVAIVLSGVYIAAEETLEKAVAAELLPRELRSLGFGILACANAVGDMASSLYVGLLLQAHRSGLAFTLAAAFGLAGMVWLTFLRREIPAGESTP